MIIYPWHPWVGKKLAVDTTITKHGNEYIRCIPVEMSELKNSDIPVWMFDQLYCEKCEIYKYPFVSLEALDELTFLLKDVFHIINRQSSSKLKGDADDKANHGETGGSVPARKNKKHLAQYPNAKQKTGCFCH